MLTAILFLLAVVSFGFAVLLFFQWRDIEFFFRMHRKADKGFSDLIQAAAVVDDGIIVNKNGSFTASWLYEGEDNESATQQAREALSAAVNDAFKKLGSGFALHIDSVRRVAPGYPKPEENAFPDKISFAIDEERRRLFGSKGVLYQGMFVLSLTWFPPSRNIRKAEDYFYDKDEKAKDKAEETIELIEKFKEQCTNLENSLSGSFSLTRLKSRQETVNGELVTFDDQLSYMHYCLTGISQPIRLPKNPVYLDRVIGCQDFWAGLPLRIGNKHFRTVSIDGFPSESYPGILSALPILPCECRWSTRFVFMDKLEAQAACKKFTSNWKQASRGFVSQIFGNASGRVNQDALMMVDDAQAANLEVQNDTVGLGYYTSVVVLCDEDQDKLEETAKTLVAKVINDLGFSARLESINNEDAFFGTIPGHVDENLRRPPLTTLNLADLMPTSTIWPGEEKCPNNLMTNYAGHALPPLMHCVTFGVTPFRLNLHVGDLGHTLILGPTGAGKSVKLCTLMAQALRYPDMQIFSFDIGRSAYALCKATGGQHYNIGAENSDLAFCPLQFLDTVQDRAWAGEWIETLVKLNLPEGESMTAADRNAIADAIETMSKKANSGRSLKDFQQTVQSETVKSYIQPYTVDGLMGFLLDASSDTLSFNSDGTKPLFTVFEIESLMQMGDRFVLPVLTYLFRRIEKSLRGQPAMIVLDEAWVMLGHPVFKEKIREWLKVLRKLNCCVVMATQSLSDMSKSGIMDVLVENCPTKIFLPNPDAAAYEESINLYRSMGLNDRQLEIIFHARKKRDYYLVQGLHRRLYSLALGPLTLAFTGVSDKESLASIQALEKRFKDDWPREWLKARNIDLDDFTEGFVPPKPHAIKTLIVNEEE